MVANLLLKKLDFRKKISFLIIKLQSAFFFFKCKYFFLFLACILLTIKPWIARGTSRHPAYMDSSLTVGQRRLPCPPCGKMGLQSYTVVVAIKKMSN